MCSRLHLGRLCTERICRSGLFPGTAAGCADRDLPDLQAQDTEGINSYTYKKGHPKGCPFLGTGTQYGTGLKLLIFFIYKVFIFTDIFICCFTVTIKAGCFLLNKPVKLIIIIFNLTITIFFIFIMGITNSL